MVLLHPVMSSAGHDKQMTDAPIISGPDLSNNQEVGGVDGLTWGNPYGTVVLYEGTDARRTSPGHSLNALVVELADTPDSKSGSPKECGFKSHRGHHLFSRLRSASDTLRVNRRSSLFSLHNVYPWMIEVPELRVLPLMILEERHDECLPFGIT